MKISAIHLKNIKGFRDLNKIERLDENLSANQNIVLFGGYNGAGKTTLLDSIYLCLYGKNATRLYPTKGTKNENYMAMVLSLFNKDEQVKGILRNEMYIEVFLNDVMLTGNFPRSISLKRIWDIENLGGKLQWKGEQFFISENGKEVEDLDRSEHEDRIEALLPYSASQFFFFDGEKIEDFAADADNEFASSLKNVLGINLYSTLYDDLKTIRSRILAFFHKNKDAELNLKDKEKERAQLEKNFNDALIEIGDLENQLSEKESELEKIHAQTFRYTRISAGDREGYLSEKDNLERERDTLISDYIDTSKDYLPFILSSDLCEELDKQLAQEEKYLGWLAAQKEIEPKITSIVNAVFNDDPPPPRPDITFEQKIFYKDKIEKTIKKFVFNTEEIRHDGTTLIHNLSSTDASKIQRTLASVNQEVVTILHKKSERLKQIEIALQRIRQTENRAGDKSQDIQSLFDKANELSERVGEIKNSIRSLKGDNEETKRKIEVVKREITSWEDRVQVAGKEKKQIEYIEKLQRVISDFQIRFQSLRTGELEEAISHMFNHLAQKEKQVTRVEIQPEKNFEVNLFDDLNLPIDKTKLSAGEKEIFAISLLWALVKVSGKDFPIIIDTPFGRLDSKHRSNIVKHYFSKAGQQVILLSQDEEIIGKYYDLLKPNLSQEFTITYDTSKRRSFVSNGYPFQKPALVS